MPVMGHIIHIAFHLQLKKFQVESWYCAPCFATGKESPEVDSSHRKEENVQGTENIVYHCVVCERLEIIKKDSSFFNHVLQSFAPTSFKIYTLE